MNKKNQVAIAIAMILAGGGTAIWLWYTADQTTAAANFFFLVAVMVAMAGLTILLIRVLKKVLK